MSPCHFLQDLDVTFYSSYKRPRRISTTFKVVVPLTLRFLPVWSPTEEPKNTMICLLVEPTPNMFLLRLYNVDDMTFSVIFPFFQQPRLKLLAR